MRNETSFIIVGLSEYKGLYMSLLIMERGPRRGERIQLNKFPVSIGRDPSNDIVIPDEECSRRHLVIKRRGKLVILEDLGSHNGTFVNGDRVINTVIRSGDKIVIGSTEFMYVTTSSDIQIVTEIMKYDMLVAEELGVSGPIALQSKQSYGDIKPIRLASHNVITQKSYDDKLSKLLFDLHSNIIVIEDLEEAAQALLKCIKIIIPAFSRGAFFLHLNTTKQLIPISVKHFNKNKENFLLSKRGFIDVISRKQGLLLQKDNPQVTYPGKSRVIFPMIYDNEVISVLHFEIDDPRVVLDKKYLEIAQAFIIRCAPSFEVLMLKKELDSWLVGMLESMIAIVEAKDTYTRGHSERVCRYSMAIAEELKLDKEVKKYLMMSSLIHDIGKIGISDSILKKATLLSADEYEEMKLHPNIGAEIVRTMPNSNKFISGIKYHHERWDGTGYPEGLVGEDIPFFGRIIGLADAFDAMISGRSYSGFIDQSDAIERLSDEKHLFDPQIFSAFIKAYEKGMITLKTDTLSNNLEADLNKASAISTKNKIKKLS